MVALRKLMQAGTKFLVHCPLTPHPRHQESLAKEGLVNSLVRSLSPLYHYDQGISWATKPKH